MKLCSISSFQEMLPLFLKSFVKPTRSGGTDSVEQKDTNHNREMLSDLLVEVVVRGSARLHCHNFTPTLASFARPSNIVKVGKGGAYRMIFCKCVSCYPFDEIMMSSFAAFHSSTNESGCHGSRSE